MLVTYRTIGTRILDLIDITFDQLDGINEDFFRFCARVIENPDEQARLLAIWEPN